MSKSRKSRRTKKPPAKPVPPAHASAHAPGEQPVLPCQYWYLALLTLVSLVLLIWALHEDMWSMGDGVIHGIFHDRNATGHRVEQDEVRAFAMLVLRAGLVVVMPLLVGQAALFLAGISSKRLNLAAASASAFACVFYSNISNDDDSLLSHILAYYAVLPQLCILMLMP